jgi:hypothetical protein
VKELGLKTKPDASGLHVAMSGDRFGRLACLIGILLFEAGDPSVGVASGLYCLGCFMQTEGSIAICCSGNCTETMK